MNDNLISLPANTAFPHKVEGTLMISVETGDVGDDEISSVNFGELKTNAGILLIEVADGVVRNAKLSRDDLYADKDVKVTIGGTTDYSGAQGPLTYLITNIVV